MHAYRSLPFVINQQTSNINNYTNQDSNHSVVYTKDRIQGLLRLEKNQLQIQWRFTRNVHRYGVEVSLDSEQFPMREHVVPISKLSEVRIRKRLLHIPPQSMLVLVSSDLQAFDPLTDNGEVPGLVLSHPAELIVTVRWTDRQLLEEFVSQLRVAISEQVLDSLEDDLKQIEGSKKRLGT